MATHGLVVRGTGGTTGGTRVQVGSNITLPAGGPWTIHDVWMMTAQATAVHQESMDAHLQIEALSGDLTPDPAPGRYPASGIDSPEGAHHGMSSIPLNLFRVNWQASGKAVLAIYHNAANALAVAPQVVAGIIFGDTIPEVRPLVFCDRVQADFAATTEQAVGTITLAEKATRIVGVLGTLHHTAANAADIPVIGTFRLGSDDVNIRPMELPFASANSPGDGTLVGPGPMPQMQFIPLDIPVEGGARIDAFAITRENVTNSASATIYVAYE